MPRPDLTRTEAEARASLIGEPSYEVTLDLTRDDGAFRSETVARFRATAGASTFIEATTTELHEVELNGRRLDPAEVSDGWRIRLDGLGTVNELRVVSTNATTNTGEGLHRFVDPVDGEAYLYTEFAVAEANRVFAVFDQPDLKAGVRFTVTAPAHWTVLSNAPSPEPVPVVERVPVVAPVPGSEPGVAGGEGVGANATWSFETGPVISSYIVALIAGPYASWHGSATSSDGREVPLGLFTRRSLAPYAEPDIMFPLVQRGLDFYESAFGVPYPYGKYDQIFVPEYNWGAMENVGAVTFNESYLFRSRVSDARREQRASVVLHELSHMWFGNSVTMRWWNDLWLNESFATWAATFASSRITEFTGAWATFANDEKTQAAEQDQLPSTHPIVATIDNTGDVEVNFDAITYDKGASVLKQLVAWVGLEPFQRGVGAYLSAHAGGNATLADLLRELELASGRELGRWSALWLETAGVNTLRATLETTAPTATDSGETGIDDAGLAEHPEVITSARIEQSAPPAHPTLRPHRIAVGCYDLVDGRLTRTHRVELDIDGASTEVPGLTGRHRPDLLLVNDDDLTYAKVRLDERSFRTAVAHLAEIADPVARAVVLGSAWDAVRDAELAASDFVRLVLRSVGHESQSSARGLALSRLELALAKYVAEEHREVVAAEAGDAVWAQTELAEPGSDAQLQLAKAFTRIASTAAHAEVLGSLLDGSLSLPGLTVDLDLRWELVIARAALGVGDDEEIRMALDADDTSKGRLLAETARAARPDADVKAAAWRRVATDRSLSNDLARAIADGWRRALPATLLAPVVDDYFAMLTSIWAERSFNMAALIVTRLFPTPLVDQGLADRARTWLAANPEPAPLARLVSEQLAELDRALAARACDARALSDLPAARN
ncbi:aminopeptidase N [Agromyces aerolatus]|uniref:aminopeptidase N n=1 Tax=Agromyces sp. LY-1074 TaxID=3074080 RepID=UPI0028571521|nr:MULTISPECIES: aminopeptidase N [unclassified Agromyces]MDR5699876.1 aminopeptidase N [Agromyces sp. LY-1074]MDR5706312.1 aminopeptidase N [Agromyces sp. LY-1358]